jgi:hypothetical protein
LDPSSNESVFAGMLEHSATNSCSSTPSSTPPYRRPIPVEMEWDYWKSAVNNGASCHPVKTHWANLPPSHSAPTTPSLQPVNQKHPQPTLKNQQSGRYVNEDFLEFLESVGSQTNNSYRVC